MIRYFYALILCSSLALAAVPIQWNASLQLKSLQSITSRLEQAPIKLPTQQQGMLMAKGQVTKKVQTCAQYNQAQRVGFEPANNAEMALSSFYVNYCQPLAYLEAARPAKVRHFHQLSLARLWRQLPAAVIFPSLTGVQTTQSVAQYTPKAKMHTLTNQSLKITKPGQYAIVTPLALADFIGNGQQQMLINVANYLDQGSYRFYQNVLVAKTNTGALRVVSVNSKGSS